MGDILRQHLGGGIFGVSSLSVDDDGLTLADSHKVIRRQLRHSAVLNPLLPVRRRGAEASGGSGLVLGEGDRPGRDSVHPREGDQVSGWFDNGNRERQAATLSFVEAALNDCLGLLNDDGVAVDARDEGRRLGGTGVASTVRQAERTAPPVGCWRMIAGHLPAIGAVRTGVRSADGNRSAMSHRGCRIMQP